MNRKNEILKGLISELEKLSYEKKVPLWKAVAKALKKPNRIKAEINIYSINKNSKKGETIIVPGTVLSNGELNNKIDIAALRFTPTAKTKIEKVGGKCMGIEDLMKSHPTGKGAKIRILV